MSDPIKHKVTVTYDRQREFLRQFMSEILVEQKSYLLQHPEIKLMLKGYIANITLLPQKPRDVLKQIALHFTKPVATLEKEMKKLVKMKTEASHICSNKVEKSFKYEKLLSLLTINDGVIEHKQVTYNTISDTTTSSFISILSSACTLMTPEFVEDLQQTTSAQMHEELLQIIDKAVLFKVTDEDIQYDIAYVEVMNAVEVAMEIPVMEIRKDVIELLRLTFYIFEFQIAEKEKMATQNAANNRLKKKLKKTVRHHQNFKGHDIRRYASENEDLPNETLAMESDKYQVKYHFNRYPKNRFGVYLPRESTFSDESVTTAVPIEEMMEKDKDNTAEIELTSSKSCELAKCEVVVVSFTELSNSGFRKNKKMNFILKNVPESHSLSQCNLQSANVILFKPSRNLFRKHQRQ